MKYLRLFEVKNDIDVFKYFKQRNKIDRIGNIILVLIREYIELNSDHFLSQYSFDNRSDRLMAGGIR